MYSSWSSRIHEWWTVPGYGERPRGHPRLQGKRRGADRRGQEADTLDITVHRSHVMLGVHLCHFLKIRI